jgi:hypothetical protein
MTYLTKIQEQDNIFLPIFGHPDYLISIRSGAIRHPNGSPVPQWLHRAGPRRFYLRCRFGLVHRVLMSARLQRQLETPEQVQHQDGNTFNNSLENLRVGNALSNARDKIASNTNGRKLHNQDVREIRVLNLPPERIAVMYGISAGHVEAILDGRRWFNLPW